MELESSPDVLWCEKPKEYLRWRLNQYQYSKLYILWGGGGMNILREDSENFQTPEWGALKKCWAKKGGGGGCSEKHQNQHDIIIQTRWFSTQQFNDLCIQLYHLLYRNNKCGLSNYYTLVHPRDLITTGSQVCHRQ